MEYTRYELQVLWYLKRHGGVVSAKSHDNKDSIVTIMAETLDIRRQSVNHALRELEKKCLLIKTYAKGGKIGSGGYDIIIKIELIDPQMYLPPLPAPLPLAAVMSRENNELLERTATEPTNEAIILALLDENEKLRAQINKLQEVVNALAKENETLKHHQAHKPRNEHLNQRVQDALPPEVWESLRQMGKRL